MQLAYLFVELLEVPLGAASVQRMVRNLGILPRAHHPPTKTLPEGFPKGRSEVIPLGHYSPIVVMPL